MTTDVPQSFEELRLLTIKECVTTFGLTEHRWKKAARTKEVEAFKERGRSGWRIKLVDARKFINSLGKTKETAA